MGIVHNTRSILRASGVFLMLAAFSMLLAQGVIAQAQSPAALPTIEAAPPSGTPTNAQDVLPIQSGDEIVGELNADKVRESYTFEGKAGDRVTISLDSFAFDPLLFLRDADGTSIEMNDDSEGSLNALIENVELPADGSYTIVAAIADGRGGGSYTLRLFVQPIYSIAYGDTVEGELLANQERVVYHFDAAEGDLVEIALNSDEFDTFLELSAFVPDAIVAREDGNGGGTNALIIRHIDKLARYYIRVTRSYPGISGRYTLSIRKIEPEIIEYGDEVSVTFDEDTSNLYYAVDAVAGDRIDIQVDSSGTLDSILKVISPRNYIKWWEDDSGAGRDPEILNGLIDESGIYIFNLQKYVSLTDSDQHTVTLKVTNHPPLTIEPGQPVSVAFGDKKQEAVLEFVTPSMKGYTVQIKSSTGTTENLSIQEFQDGHQAKSFPGTIDESILSYAGVYDSEIQVRYVLTDYSYRPVEYTITLLPLVGQG